MGVDGGHALSLAASIREASAAIDRSAERPWIARCAAMTGGASASSSKYPVIPRDPATPSFAGAQVQGRRSFSVGGKRGIQYAAASRLNHSRLWNTGSPGQAGRRQRVLQTRLRILAARFARALLGRSTLEAKRAQGRPGADLAPAVRCAKSSARKPHSSIQVVPITRPSLRDGWTAYAVLSREPSSFWPPSPLRKSPSTAPVDATAAFAST